MEIREYRTYGETDILNLYASVGWTAYTRSPEVLRKGFENSLLTLAAYEGERLIGIIRAVGDGHTVIFIQDLLVLPENVRNRMRRFYKNLISLRKGAVASI
ncbi:MAG TPA: hypothetical protein H9744_01690 [Candidatus Eisenbergiella stercoravium]|nr:hypothetical protein [Candidatus Eisenbergiella stercoravium]